MENHELGVNTNRMLWLDEYFGPNVADWRIPVNLKEKDMFLANFLLNLPLFYPISIFSSQINTVSARHMDAQLIAVFPSLPCS